MAFNLTETTGAFDNIPKRTVLDPKKVYSTNLVERGEYDPGQLLYVSKRGCLQNEPLGEIAAQVHSIDHPYLNFCVLPE
jgi:hypothetical protein